MTNTSLRYFKAMLWNIKNISNVLEMSEMDNAKGIFEKSSSDQNDKHEFKIFQSYALKYKKH